MNTYLRAELTQRTRSRWMSPWRFPVQKLNTSLVLNPQGCVQLLPVSQMSFCTLMFSLSFSAWGVSTHRTSTPTVCVHCIFLWITFQTVRWQKNPTWLHILFIISDACFSVRLSQGSAAPTRWSPCCFSPRTVTSHLSVSSSAFHVGASSPGSSWSRGLQS